IVLLSAATASQAQAPAPETTPPPPAETAPPPPAVEPAAPPAVVPAPAPPAAAPVVVAPPARTPEEIAIGEAVYREANRITFHQKLEAAHNAQARRELVNAAKLYDECWDLIQKIGSGVEGEIDDTRAGLAAVRLE